MPTAEAPSAVMTTEVIPVTVPPITDPSPLKGSSTDRQYISEWRFADRKTNYNLEFKHGLKDVPTSMLVLFADPKMERVFPKHWSWTQGESGNPICIWNDNKTKTIFLSIGKDVPLHGWWDGANPSLWTCYDTGFFRVIASV